MSVSCHHASPLALVRRYLQRVTGIYFTCFSKICGLIFGMDVVLRWIQILCGSALILSSVWHFALSLLAGGKNYFKRRSTIPTPVAFIFVSTRAVLTLTLTVRSLPIFPTALRVHGVVHYGVCITAGSITSLHFIDGEDVTVLVFKVLCDATTLHSTLY